jgi:deazaflavin-dependent oxidoreductase (nitroreductase family)
VPPLRGWFLFLLAYPRLAPLRQAQGRLWAAFCRRFAAGAGIKWRQGFWEREGGIVATSKETLKERLGRYREIRISVIGRKSGRKISIPVWFVLEGETVYLLPVSGSKTQWYKNVLKNPTIGIETRGAEGEFRAEVVTGAKVVKSVVEKFREKYGAGDVKKYYSGFDVAVVVKLE